MTGLTALLIFAAWTLAMMFASRAYRLSLIATFKKGASEFPRGAPNTDPAFFVRAEHAHLNCLENLPLFAAIVIAAQGLGQMAVVDGVAAYFIIARIAQSTIHLIGTSEPLVMARATIFFVQVILYVYMFLNLL